MISEERKIQMRVGVFVLVGLTTIGIMTVYLGRVGESMRYHYRLDAHFPNASGIKKGADVLLSGARVGRVATSPSILPDMKGVSIQLLIDQRVTIPRGSRFTISSSGLLGDRFIDILVGKGATDTKPILPGAIVHGEYASGIEDLVSTVNSVAEQTSELIACLGIVVQDVGQVARKVCTSNLLQPQNLKNFSETLANLKEVSGDFARLSKKTEGLLASADVAFKEGKKTLISARMISREISQALKSEQNTVGLFLSNKEVAENVRAFILNMRKHGVFWYKDTTQCTQTRDSP
ncbi:mce related protein [Candidatus Xiphinematobacter sp. Idaho Grape]|uniref:MlaD family protein n=1 Tax=Candidatus Xiphinematobacter sp. Idaho Grape TaxID=1704307 RepID=UPI000706C9A5|nr:MlaD family protein [Candidatus Xiphinematobacter sp. Idaho Grape]ALJ56743.1 mce related protein [Candidatus Xiphinematobacter sp. Idaho Grape]